LAAVNPKRVPEATYSSIVAHIGEPLVKVFAQEGCYEFMLMVAPLRVVGGTGSPVNPIALF
jgi:hypothetical protein